jgi:hypothetical protein
MAADNIDDRLATLEKDDAVEKMLTEMKSKKRAS